MQISWPPELISQAGERYAQWSLQLSKETSSAQKQELAWMKQLLVVSDYAYEWAQKYPQWFLQIDGLLKKSFEEIKGEFEQISQQDINAISEFDLKRWLRHQHHLYSIACAAFQLTNHLSIREITYLQSLLARQLILAAYRWVKYQFVSQYGFASSAKYPQQDLVIMLMGKLGGGELNFSSDIDLIFCYPEDGETQVESGSSGRSIENQKYFRRLSQKLVALLHETTADGFVYRVDMRLRPYGQSGALTLSFDGMADYYLEQGREWERFAMIKADYLCDDGSAKVAIQKIITPFSFRRYIDFSVLDAIRQLKQKITTEMQYRELNNDIKLGQGGIRELEFILQSLQLISGGRKPELQVKNWWQTLHVLEADGLLQATDAEQLKSAYEFLRCLENILQIQGNAQTQLLPVEQVQKQLVAFAMGFSDWNSMSAELDGHRTIVENFFKQLFQDPAQELDPDNQLKNIEYYFSGDVSEDKVFDASQSTDEELLALAKNFKQKFINEKFGQRGQTRLNQLLPHLVLNVRKTPNCLVTFERCLSLMQSIGRRTAYFELLAENLPLLEHLVSLVSRSKWLVEQLKQYPSLLDELLFPANFGKILTKNDFQSALRQELLRIEPENIEEQLLAIGRFKVASQFKVAAGFLNHRFHILEVTRQLTDVAELCLQELLLLAWRELAKKHGVPAGASAQQVSDFVVLGYGKLGSHELGFGSDLDLVFLYRGNPNAQTDGARPIDVSQFYTRLTQRLVHYLNTRTQQGIMYEVDTRLRPSGRSGLLVSEFNAFVKYQQNDAWTWEKQALVRARVVAGDEHLTKDYQATRPLLLQSEQNLPLDIVEMRQKMRASLDRTSDSQWDIKQGQGGLVDIEFLVQYWILDLAQKGEELPDIYSNHFWLHWLEQQESTAAETSKALMSIYEDYQSIINQKRLDMLPGILDSDEMAESRQLISRLWASTFEDVKVQ